MSWSSADPARFYTPKDRPSGHAIGEGFGKDNGGAIPSHLLQLPNTESNSGYLRLCKLVGVEPHPARFSVALPDFFIRFLTDPGDLVADIFGGSGTTAEAAERAGRRWLTIELDRSYVRGAALRFLADRTDAEAVRALAGLDAGEPDITLRQGGLFAATA